MHLEPETSMQLVSGYRGSELVDLRLPPPEQQLAGHDLSWGRAEEIGSPAYWAAQAWMWEQSEPDHYRLGRSLRDEVLACLLGGYGIPAEVGLAAYRRLRAAPPIELTDELKVYALLAAPLDLDGRAIRYRFARQKARYVAGTMRRLERLALNAPDRALRDALMDMPGIGPKTASWIVRNWRSSDDVAILDIHIIRAGRAIGIFDFAWRVDRHYSLMEEAYLDFASAIGARPSILDSVIWMTMRRLPDSIVALIRPSRKNDTVHFGAFDTGRAALV